MSQPPDRAQARPSPAWPTPVLAPGKRHHAERAVEGWDGEIHFRSPVDADADDAGIERERRLCRRAAVQLAVAAVAAGPDLALGALHAVNKLAKIRTGGDGGGDELQSSPPTQAPLALYSGIVTVAQDGTAQVSFDIPAFAGTVRVMAVAWSKDKLGHARADLTVRDPVVLTATCRGSCSPATSAPSPLSTSTISRASSAI